MYLEKPIGVFALLDEESMFPRATDDTLGQDLQNSACACSANSTFVGAVGKFITHFQSRSMFSVTKGDSRLFTIAHYAGKVTYDTTGFLDKNKDMYACVLSRTPVRA
jgi:myosin heavy subunit